MKRGAYLSTRQYARLVDQWVALVSLDPAAYGTHSMRRTKVSLLYNKTGNLQSLPAPVGPHQAGEQRRYLGVDDAQEPSEALEL